MVMGPGLAPFNPILSQQPLDKYEGARIKFRREHKSCLTQWTNLIYILDLKPNGNGACFRPIQPSFAPTNPGEV